MAINLQLLRDHELSAKETLRQFGKALGELLDSGVIPHERVKELAAAWGRARHQVAVALGQVAQALELVERAEGERAVREAEASIQGGGR